MTPRAETVRLLLKNGFVRKRNKGHEVFFNKEKNLTIPVPNHNFPEQTKRYILKEAGIKE